MNPTISIVMPSFNQGEFLEAAIESVLDQDYPLIELIVIDGGSNDESVDILQRYDARIAHWVSEPDRGQSDALNKGFKKVTGDIVGWLNSDDTFQPGSFREIAEVFSNENIQIAMCQQFGLMEANGVVYSHKKNSYTSHRTLARFWATNGMTINQPSVFFRPSLLTELKFSFDLQLHYAMDYDLWLKISERHPIHVVPGYWANYRFHDTSKSGTGFGKFFPEWYAVSQRYWGRPKSPEWWNNWFSHIYHHYGRRVVSGAARRCREVFNG